MRRLIIAEAESVSTDRTNNMYGTTLGVWDPVIQAWRVRACGAQLMQS
jgi:hypothetical protein